MEIDMPTMAEGLFFILILIDVLLAWLYIEYLYRNT